MPHRRARVDSCSRKSSHSEKDLMTRMMKAPEMTILESFRPAAIDHQPFVPFARRNQQQILKNKKKKKGERGSITENSKYID